MKGGEEKDGCGDEKEDGKSREEGKVESESLVASAEQSDNAGVELAEDRVDPKDVQLGEEVKERSSERPEAVEKAESPRIAVRKRRSSSASPTQDVQNNTPTTGNAADAASPPQSPRIRAAKKPKKSSSSTERKKSRQSSSPESPHASTTRVVRAANLPKNGPSHIKNVPGTRLFIGNFASEGTKADELLAIFSRYGTIIEQPTIRKSYAFIQYDNPDSVLRAIAQENHHRANGLAWELSIAGTRPPAKSISSSKQSALNPSSTDNIQSVQHRYGHGGRALRVRVMGMGTTARPYAERVSRTISGRFGVSCDVVSTDRATLRGKLDDAAEQRIVVVVVVAGRDEKQSVCSVRTLESGGYEKLRGRSEMHIEEAYHFIGTMRASFSQPPPPSTADADVRPPPPHAASAYGWTPPLPQQPPPPQGPPPHGKNTWLSNSGNANGNQQQRPDVAPMGGGYSGQGRDGAGMNMNVNGTHAPMGYYSGSQQPIPFGPSSAGGLQQPAPQQHPYPNHQPSLQQQQPQYPPPMPQVAPPQPYPQQQQQPPPSQFGLGFETGGAPAAYGNAGFEQQGGNMVQQQVSGQQLGSYAQYDSAIAGQHQQQQQQQQPIDLAQLSGFLSSFNQAQQLQQQQFSGFSGAPSSIDAARGTQNYHTTYQPHQPQSSLAPPQQQPPSMYPQGAAPNGPPPMYR